MLFGNNIYNAATTLNAGILGVGNANALGNAAGSIVFNGGTLQHVNSITTDFSGRFSATGGNAYRVDTTTLSVTYAANLPVAGSSGLSKFGTGTLTLTGANAFTGTVTIGGGTGTLQPLSGGTLQVGNSTAGSLVGTNDLNFQGTGTFNVQRAADTDQAMGALTFSAGNGTVQSTFNTSTTTSSSVTFSSLGSRGTGATGNFVTSAGTNGTTNKIVITGATTGQLLDRGLYFGGSNYAAYDAVGFARAYTTTDADAVSSPAAATLGTVTAASNSFVTGAITAQTTASVNTMNIVAANNITLDSGATLSVNGILKSGGVGGASTAVISGGTGLRPIGNGDELVFRTDVANDTLTIGSPLLANGTNALTKSGAGLLKLSGAYGLTGNVAINEGTLQLDNSADVTLSSIVTGAGALTKTGTGKLTLNGTAPSTYTGPTVINNSTLVLDYSNTATPTNMLSPVSRITMGSPSVNNGVAGIATLIIKGKSGPGVVTTQTLSQLSSKTGLIIGNNTARILVDPNGGQETRVLGGWLGNVSTAARDNGNALVIGYANDGTTNPVSASTGGVVFTEDAAATNLPSNGGKIFGRIAWAWNGGVAGTNMDFVVGSPVQSNNPMGIYPVGTYGTSYGVFTPATSDNNNSYRITSASGNIVTTATTGVNGLKIENPAAGQKLTFTQSFRPDGGILMTGSNDFTIEGSTISTPTSGGDGSVTILQYSTGTLTISSVLNRVGNAALVKLGPGRLILAGANIYSGTTAETLLNEGILQAGITDTGTSGPFGNMSQQAAGAFVFGGGTLQYSSVNNYDYSSKFSTGAGQPIKVDTNGQNVSFATILSSAGGTLDKFGAGTLSLSAANTYTGTTTFAGGNLRANFAETPGATPSGPFGAPATPAGSLVFAGGALQYSAANTYDYSPRFSTAAGQPIRIDTNTQNVSFATALSSSGGTLTKAGDGTLTLSAVNTYTGVTSVVGGTLALDSIGTIANSSKISLGSAGTLDVTGKGFDGLTLASGQEIAGDGLVLGKVSLGNGSIISPGTNVGILSFDGDLLLSSSAMFNFQLGSNVTPGTTYDQIKMRYVTNFGLLDLAGIGFSNFNFTTLEGFGEGTYTLFDSGVTTGSLGSSLEGAIGNLVGTLSTSSGAVLLTVVSVPEPGTAALLVTAAGLAAAATACRRRR